MKFTKERTKDYFLLDTKVENMFINEYLAAADGDYVKVYLFALMYTELDVEFDNEDIAKQLAMDIEDVYKAWSYWEKMGVIRKRNINPENSLEYDVEFVMLKQMLYGSSQSQTVHETEASSTIGARMASQEYRTMSTRVEKALGRVISGTEMGEIMSWVDDMGTDPEVIGFAFEYCARKNKKTVRYVGTVIRNWIEEGYRTIEEVKNHLGEVEGRGGDYRRVFQALGFRRLPSEEEKRLMDLWFDKMNHDMETVLAACAKTAGISSPSISYVNRVLENWYEEGRATVKSGNGPSTSEVMAYYELLRNTEAAEAEQRRREVYEKVPRIKEIEEEEQQLTTDLTKVILSDAYDRKEQTERIKGTMDELNMEKALLLTDNNFELDYMDIRYTCQLCRDTGMLETGERCQCLDEITSEKIKMLQKNK